MNKYLAFSLAALALVVTGCPRNYYTVELTPKNEVMERRLTFARGDEGSGTNISYEAVSEDELALITSLYPRNGRILSGSGRLHIFTGEFGNVMPPDVGGAGYYTNLTTALGSAGFYSERFRGNDDLAGTMEVRFKAADQLTDILLGWSRMELGREAHYEDLRRFLDADVRHDLKNQAAYFWLGQITPVYGTNTGQELGVRASQYLVERGYVKLADVPVLFSGFLGNDEEQAFRVLQRLVASKLGLPESQPAPKSLAFLANSGALQESLGKYLATTPAYRAALSDWERDKKKNPSAPKPDPLEVMKEPFEALTGIILFGDMDDHLTVRLFLPTGVIHTNGKWDAEHKLVVWESDLAARTNQTRYPVMCYANWSQPDEAFQKEHLGKVGLGGEDLSDYCLWRAGLSVKRAGEWDALVAGLQPGKALGPTIDAFRFSDEPQAPEKKSGQPAPASPSEYARQLLKSAVEK